MKYDLIIVSQSRSDLVQTTQNCIDSARKDDADLNIIIVETGQPYKYDVDKIIEYNGEFNYNRALNMGLKYAKGDVRILANNDILFHKGWSEIGYLMELNGYHSASYPNQNWKSKGLEKGDVLYEGYSIGLHITGWCIFMDRYCHEQIGLLDESVNFWFSDDLYAYQIKAAGIKHALFCNCQVDHLVSRTLVKQNVTLQRNYTMGQQRICKERERYYAERKRVYQVNT